MSAAERLTANKEIGRRVLVEIWGEGRVELIPELYAPDYVDHVAHGPEPSEVSGPAALAAAVAQFRTGFPDLNYSVDLVLAEDDLVMARFRATGHHHGNFLGLDPTGREIGYTGMDLNRIRNGRVVESWVQYDALGLLQQLGLAPTVGGAQHPL